MSDPSSRDLAARLPSLPNWVEINLDAVEANVRQSVRLIQQQVKVARLAEHGKVRVTGGVYDLKTGRVRFLEV